MEPNPEAARDFFVMITTLEAMSYLYEKGLAERVRNDPILANALAERLVATWKDRSGKITELAKEDAIMVASQFIVDQRLAPVDGISNN